MTNKEILRADMLDILFEHRNKTYGAYALRRNYNNRLGAALGASLAAVLLFILLSAFLRKKDKETNHYKHDEVTIANIDLPEKEADEPEKKKEQPKPKPEVAKVDYQKVVVVPDKEAPETLPDMDDLSKAQVSNENMKGTPPGDEAKLKDDNNGKGDGETDKPKEPDFIPGPSRAASFPEGQDAWLNFLRRYLQTPDDLQAGQRVEVKVRFWVDADGSVSRFEIVQSGGPLFDKEVLRVMKKMPKWEPALQNGNKVSTSFTQPVTFIGVEE